MDKISKTLSLYTGLMEEIKVRMRSINYAITGSTGLPDILVKEYMYLQLRLVCELIAISCLVAHGDMLDLQTTRMQKAYNPAEIIKKLTDLRPHFYPQPYSRFSQTSQGFHIDGQLTGGFLTKESLLRLHAKCGDILHRGGLKQLTARNASVKHSYPDVISHLDQIYALLKIHRIRIIENENDVLCLFNNDSMQASAVFIEATPPA